MQPLIETVERRVGTQRFVEQMLEERQEMWVLYCKVAGLEPFENRERHPTSKELVDEFCQVLVDYISTGHFGLYERIAEGKERRGAVRSAAACVYERIARTTDVAVSFNDMYDATRTFDLNDDFARDLSELGEALALRIELEDAILERMA